ncbi:mechanosensitive ion channel MscS [Glycocaulis alkaliphilus]|uniref:Mechanosensitive ion channel MscS n=1 Tax=Glycocaulis alkaliphilus TaxID=1434191 RepID=A0A3T0EBN8_9PROT|nr:mechanosensitive ion channel family protein [Glycocaulis alkaliphilus]AZU04617.1 mechanosensitive ion channel MscS [Glycocaulis alkaliphilus]GGB69059.1 mechanosensitive ion channel protein MscS [Glycocaulis alkaliphilus]
METMNDLWAIVVDVWTTSFLGLNVGQALVGLLVVALAFAVRGLVGWAITKFLLAHAQKTTTQMDEKVVRALSGPIRMIPIIIGVYIAVLIVGLDQPDGEGPGLNLVRTLIVIAIFWALHNVVTPISYLLRPLQRALGPVLVDWLAKTLRILFVVVGAGAVLQLWGIPVAPIVAGLGLFGVAVGLGAQDLFKNLISGLLVLTEKRFLPGEWILVDGVVEGTVEQINFRSTLVRRFDRSPVYVPNSFLSDRAVTNFSRMTHRRIRWMVGVEYKTTKEQLQYIRDKTLEWLDNHPGFAKPPEVATFMRVDSFGPSSIDYLLYCFTHTTNWGEWLALKEELALALKDIVEGAGTAFAFPSTSVYMDDGVEVFVPPKVSAHGRKTDPDANPDAKAAPETLTRGEEGDSD